MGDVIPNIRFRRRPRGEHARLRKGFARRMPWQREFDDAVDDFDRIVARSRR
jgi:hypothetical protein